VTASETLTERLNRGDVIVLDGGIGSELEARGIPMNYVAWCGLANLEHQDIVESVHEDYIAAGADVITANTFAIGRKSFEAAGCGDRFVEANQRAVQAARAARDRAAEREVAVAGAVSGVTARSLAAAKREDRTILDEDALWRGYREQASILADAGVDLLLLEMINSPAFGPIAVAAALETGLPVWLGVSPGFRVNGDRAEPDHTTMIHGEISLESLLDELLRPELQAVNVMHATTDVVESALEIVVHRWNGPVGVYPESGTYTRPHWEFGELSPEAFLGLARGWVDRGAQIVGGCCGIRPAHIRAIRDGLPNLAPQDPFKHSPSRR
jgi:S-methylmethionine-dependent homocysteine/selenocysteine methylase